MDDKVIKASSAMKVVKPETYAASLDAKDIVAAARAEADAIRESAREEGRALGLREWNEKVAEVLRARDRYLKECEPEVLRIAVRVAEKILGEQLKIAPESCVSIVQEALRSLHRERSVTIQVNPDQLEIVRAATTRLHDALGDECRVRVVSSSAVASGGCVIETELGTVDARIDTQLRCMEEILLREAKS